MAAGNQQFETETALVVALGATLLESKLGAMLARLHFPTLHAWVQWWPLLLIAAGVVLLLTDRAPGTRSREITQPQVTDAQRGDQ
jgi:hypothetical protein